MACLGGGTGGGDMDRFETQTQKAEPNELDAGDGKGRNDRKMTQFSI